MMIRIFLRLVVHVMAVVFGLRMINLKRSSSVEIPCYLTSVIIINLDDDCPSEYIQIIILRYAQYSYSYSYFCSLLHHWSFPYAVWRLGLLTIHQRSIDFLPPPPLVACINIE